MKILLGLYENGSLWVQRVVLLMRYSPEVKGRYFIVFSSLSSTSIAVVAHSENQKFIFLKWPNALAVSVAVAVVVEVEVAVVMLAAAGAVGQRSIKCPNIVALPILHD